MLRTPRLILVDVSEVTTLVQRLQMNRVVECKIIEVQEYDNTAMLLQTCKAPSN